MQNFIKLSGIEIFLALILIVNWLAGGAFNKTSDSVSGRTILITLIVAAVWSVYKMFVKK